MHSRSTWPDNLRVIATLSMVLLHVISPILYRFGKIDFSIWQFGNVIDSSVRFCVPIFVMLSGALLLHKEYSISDFLKKRLFRVILPFAFWSSVYIIHDLSYQRSIGVLDGAEFIVNKLIHGASYHLWYIYMIIGVYLFIPIIGKWVRTATQKELHYFLGIWLITLIFNLPAISYYKPSIEFSYFSGFVGYLVLGYYLSRIKKQSGKAWSKKTSILLIIAGIAVTAVATSLNSRALGKFTAFWYGNLTLNVLLSSTGVFMLITNYRFKLSISEKIRDFLCKHSFGIYLIHVLILTQLNKFGLNCFYVHPVIGVSLTWFSCILVSGTLVWLISKFPYGKYFAG